MLSTLPFVSVDGAGRESETGAFLNESAETITIGNQFVELTLYRATGGIKQLSVQNQEQQLITDPSTETAQTWAVEFDDPSTDTWTGPGKRPSDSIVTDTTMDADISLSQNSEGKTTSISIDWNNPRLVRDGNPGERFQGTVSVTVSVTTGDPLTYWDVSVTNKSNLAIKSITCPKIVDIGALTDDNSGAIVLPHRIGRRYPAPKQRFNKFDDPIGIDYPSGFGTMQYTAFTSSGGGFYADARDTEGYVKRLRWGPSPHSDRIMFEAIHHSTLAPGSDVVRPYSVTFGPLNGGWHAAAERYRDWITTEGWLSPDPPEKPEWLLDLGATFRIDAYPPNDDITISYERAAEFATEMADYLGVPTQFQLAQWMSVQEAGTSPPIESWDSFANAIDKATSAGVPVSTLIGSSDKGKDTDLFETNPDAENWVVRGPEQKPVFQGGTHDDFLIEATQDGWQQFIRGYMQTLRDHGITEIAYDGFPLMLPECHAEQHAHAPGWGGNWFATRARADVRQLQSLLRTRQQGVLSGEGICDYYLPYLDVFNTFDVTGESYEHEEIDSEWVEMIPLFPYTFSEYIVTRTYNFSGVNPAVAPSLTWLFVGRAIQWGALPLFRYADPKNPANENTPPLSDAPPALKYQRRVATARATFANRFLARGKMLPSPRIDVSEITISGWHDTTVPTSPILASSWESDIGETGVILTNISPATNGKSMTVSLNHATQPYTTPEGSTLAYVVQDGTYRALDDTERHTVTVAPGGVIAVVLAPESPERSAALSAILDAQDVAPGQSSLLEEAKRAFEAHRYSETIDKAQQVLETNATTTTTTATRTESSSTTTISTTEESTTATTSTTAPTPGFGILTTLATATLGVIHYLRRRTGEDDS